MAQVVVGSAIVATALLIPVVTGLTGGSSTATGGASSCAVLLDGSSGVATVDSACASGGSAGSTDGGGSGAGTESASGSTGAAGGSIVSGSSVVGSSSGSGDGLTPASDGSLAGYVLIFSDDPPDTNEPASNAVPDAPAGAGSKFDDLPPGELARIEEDWELTVADPDALVSAPQIGTVMTPFEDAETLYLAFALNHRVNSTFNPGGLELQLWFQGQLIGWFTMGSELLATPNEKVTWTQRLELNGGKLRFSVVDGKSSTWQEFGQGESMHLEIATTLSDLNDYHPKVSVENSGVTFAANRVGTLILKKVRGYDNNGTLLVEDKDAIVVFGGQ